MNEGETHQLVIYIGLRIAFLHSSGEASIDVWIRIPLPNFYRIGHLDAQNL